MASQNSNTILNLMYRGTTTIQNFCWDNMTTVPIYSLMSPQDVESIRDLIMSPRYSGNNKLKMEKIDDLMHFRGFTRFAGGTNRLVYVHPAAPNAVFKVAIDSIGINDNPAEFRNQYFLKPYCCKVFECSPCGTIASFEKVERITTFEEFYSIADDYFYILSRVILGKYVMEDIGTNYFMNIGIRRGCHPVILDFPYLFELDGRKLECSAVMDDGSVCHGEIDYDRGFNKLICGKCGREYRARDLAKPPEGGGMLLRRQGGSRMTIEFVKDGKVVKTATTGVERDHLSKFDKEVRRSTGLKVEVPNWVANTEEKKPAPVNKSKGLKVKVPEPKKADSEARAKPEGTSTEKPLTKGFAATEPIQNAPVLDRVITVSFGKTTTKVSDTIVKGSSKSGLKVALPEETEEEEYHVDASTFVEPTEVKQEEPVVEEAVVNEEPKEEATVVEETVVEEEPEMVEESSEAEEPKTEEQPKQMIEALTFGDEPTEEEEAPVEDKEESSEEESISEEELVEELKEAFDQAEEEQEEAVSSAPVRMFFSNQLPKEEDAESNIFYCIRITELTKEDSLLEADYMDPKDIDENKYNIYMKIDGKLSRIVYDFDEETWCVADDDDDGVYVVDCVDVLPAVEDANECTIYCVPEDESVEHFERFETSDATSIDSKNYALFMLIDGEIQRVEVGEDGDLYHYESHLNNGADKNPEDEDLEAFKNSAKKKSLD